MKSDYLQNLSTEDRNELRKKAKEKMEAKKLLAQENMVTDFGEDEIHWKSLAKKYGLRLPRWYVSNSETKYLRRAMKKLNVDTQDYLDYCGASTMKQLVDMNPNYPAAAEVGMFLEYVEENGGD